MPTKHIQLSKEQFLQHQELAVQVRCCEASERTHVYNPSSQITTIHKATEKLYDAEQEYYRFLHSICKQELDEGTLVEELSVTWWGTLVVVVTDNEGERWKQ